MMCERSIAVCVAEAQRLRKIIAGEHIFCVINPFAMLCPHSDLECLRVPLGTAVKLGISENIILDMKGLAFLLPPCLH